MICEGCLSVDRKLIVVGDDILKIYLNFLDTEYCNKLVQLCWECEALIKRFLRFKRQVQCAHTVLLGYLIPESKSLSTLQKTKCSNLIQLNHETQEFPAFVKTEAASDSEPDDGSLAGENDEGLKEDWVEITVEENAVKTEINCDPILQVPELEESKARKRSEASDDFNESDDEPLKPSERDKDKPRAKRRNKSEGVRRGGKRKRSPGVVSGAGARGKLRKLNVDSEQLEMVILTWDEVEAERQRALRSASFLRHAHRCYSCVLGFNHSCKLHDHNAKKHHPSCGAEECSVCRVRLRDARSLTAHRRRHVSRWRCRRCGEMWSRVETAADHAAREHGAPAPAHACSVCGHVETTLGRLRVHIRTHAGKQKCELCGKIFRNKDTLRTHLFIHKGVKEHACPRCDKKFLFKKAMEVHLVSHDASAHLYCHECDKNFKNQQSFDQHMRYNLKHVDPAKLKHACALCDKKFVKATRLEEHNLAVHLKVTPFSCSEPNCSFACSSRPVLRTHVRMVHRNARARRDHVCELCGKAYCTKKNLEGHLRTHSGERPYRCELCGAAFGYQAALYNHNRLVHLKNKASRRSTVPEWPAAVLAPLPVDKTSTHDTGTSLL